MYQTSKLSLLYLVGLAPLITLIVAIYLQIPKDPGYLFFSLNVFIEIVFVMLFYRFFRKPIYCLFLVACGVALVICVVALDFSNHAGQAGDGTALMEYSISAVLLNSMALLRAEHIVKTRTDKSGQNE